MAEEPKTQALADVDLDAVVGAGHTIKLENATVASIRHATASSSAGITDGTSNTLMFGETKS